ncbi:MAG: ABC transporter permease [Bacteroidales bacterium]
MNKFSFRLLLMIGSGLLLLFIIAPIVGMFISTSAPDLFATINDEEVLKSIRLTLLTSLGATIFMSIGAIPLAYLLARRNFFLKRLVLGIIDLPIVIPHSAAGIAMLGFLSRNSLLGKAASSVGLEFVGNPFGIAAAMAFVSIPFLVNAARDGFLSVPVRLEKTAMSLGASPARVFFTISVPLAGRSIISGFVMMFARGLSEFGAIVIIAYHPMVTPVLIFERFGSYGLQYARPVAVVFILVCLIFFILLRYISGGKKNA